MELRRIAERCEVRARARENLGRAEPGVVRAPSREQVRDARNGNDRRKNQGFARQKPAIRQRTISCPDHASIEIALKILVQGASTARHKACADNRVEQEQKVYATARSHVKANESGEQHE